MTVEDKGDLAALERLLGLEPASGTADRAGGGSEVSIKDAAVFAALAEANAADAPDGLLDSIDHEIDGLKTAPIITIKADDGEWTKRFNKIWQKVLFSDPATGQRIYLLRCEPEAIIPEHQHERDEHVYVIEGEYWVGDELLKAGDYQVSAAGSFHPRMRTPGGCLIMVTV